MSKRPRVPKPNPEIYRRAAELVATGEETFTCFAVDRGQWESINGNHRGLYTAQYSAVFGSHIYEPEITSYTDLPGQEFFGIRHTYLTPDETLAAIRSHPYWCKDRTKKHQNYRVMALLFMAEMVENP